MPRYWKLGCFLAIVCAVTPAIWVSLTWKPRDYVWNLGKAPTAKDLTDHLGGDKVVEILMTAEHSTAVLLEQPDEEDGRPAHEYKQASEPRPVRDSVRNDIARVLTNPDLHRGLDAVTSCLPVYGVRVSFFKNENRVDLFFCFTCDDLAVYVNDTGVGQMKFMFACKRLLTDVLEIFPESEVLKSRMEHCLR